MCRAVGLVSLQAYLTDWHLAEKCLPCTLRKNETVKPVVGKR